MLKSEQSAENEARLENLEELVGSIQGYTQEANEPSLSDYLERVSLSEEAVKEDGTRDRVMLMTVHSAKGLEFDVVFVTGLEDGMFPYKGTDPGADPGELEEERRLAYVAITRARKQLVLSFARFRQIFGTTRVNPPSRFLDEIPSEVLTQPVTRLRVSTMPSTPSTPRTVTQNGSSIRIEYDEPMSPVHEALGHSFRRGMRVKHAKYGVGKVEQIEPGSELKVIVHFPGFGSKKVLADFLSAI
jgi:DNA helicase-2/ATP-dependent DNA helicase PcrA